jgi:hypothetical protein
MSSDRSQTQTLACSHLHKVDLHAHSTILRAAFDFSAATAYCVENRFSAPGHEYSSVFLYAKPCRVLMAFSYFQVISSMALVLYIFLLIAVEQSKVFFTTRRLALGCLGNSLLMSWY